MKAGQGEFQLGQNLMEIIQYIVVTNYYGKEQFILDGIIFLKFCSLHKYISSSFETTQGPHTISVVTFMGKLSVLVI